MNKIKLLNDIEKLKNYARQHATKQEKIYIDQIMADIKYELNDNAKCKNEIEAYIDGSYDYKNNICGSGAVILKNGNIIKRKQKVFTSLKINELRNNAGEICSAIMAIDYAVGVKAKKLTLYFDCETIEKWAFNVDLKKMNSLRLKYYQKVASSQRFLDIEFVKITAHSNNTFHNNADRLAKEAIQLKLKEIKNKKSNKEKQNETSKI